MEITIMPNDVTLTLADETYLSNRLCYGLAANYRDVGSVQISLCAAPGAEAGDRLRCRVDIALVDGSAASGESMESNLYVAMDRSVDRACANITRNIDWNWRFFSQTETTSSTAARLSLAA